MRLNKKFLLRNILNEETQSDNNDATKGIDDLLSILQDKNYSGSYYDTSSPLIYLDEDENSYTFYLYSDVQEKTTENSASNLRKQGQNEGLTDITPTEYMSKNYFENSPFKCFTGTSNAFHLDISDNIANSNLSVESFDFFSIIPIEEYNIISANNESKGLSRTKIIDGLKKLKKEILNNFHNNQCQVLDIQNNVKEDEIELSSNEQTEYNSLINNEKIQQEYHFNTQLTDNANLGEFTNDEKTKISSNVTLRINPALLIRDTKSYSIKKVADKCTETVNNALGIISENPNPIISSSLSIASEMIQEHTKSSKSFYNISYTFKKNEILAANKLDDVFANLRVYPPEILAPMAFLNQSCKYNGASENAIKKALVQIFGNGNESDFQSGKIIYPMNQGNGLVDSYIQFKNNRQIGISTKAGLDGKGAAASTKSLLQPLFNMDKIHIAQNNLLSPDEIIELIKSDDSTQFCKNIYDGNIEQNDKKRKLVNTKENLIILLSFALNEPQNHGDIFQSLESYEKIFSLLPKDQNNKPKFTTGGLRTEGMSELIMYILDSLSYNFAQINTLITSPSSSENQNSSQVSEAQNSSNKKNENETEEKKKKNPIILTGNNISFNIQHTVQYPAVFNGTAQLEVGSYKSELKNGKKQSYKVVRFHIV